MKISTKLTAVSFGAILIGMVIFFTLPDDVEALLIAESYILRYDKNTGFSHIEKMSFENGMIISEEVLVNGVHDLNRPTENPNLHPFYVDNETFLFQYVQDWEEYAIFKVKPGAQGFEEMWRGTFTGDDGLWTSFAIFYINDEPHLFKIKKSNGNWDIHKIIVDERRTQVINTGDWSDGWDNVVPFHLGDVPYLFMYKSDEEYEGVWIIEKIENEGTSTSEQTRTEWRPGWNMIGFDEIEPHILSWVGGRESQIDQIDSDARGTSNWCDDCPQLADRVNSFTVLGVSYIVQYYESGGPATFYKPTPSRNALDSVGLDDWGGGWDQIVPFILWKDTTPSGNGVECTGGCGVTCAIYGSALSPIVQELRETRDNTVMATQSGSSFMNTFLALYYTFSPTIADWERSSPEFKEAVKVGITPMLLSLSLLNHVNIDSEEEMLGYGIGVILLNVGMYIVAPAIVVTRIINRLRS